MTLLLGLFYIYRKSPKSKKSLVRSFESLEMKPILPTRIGGTRWLPHVERALKVFFKGYRAFCYHLQNSSHENSKAEGLAKLATDGHVVVFMLKLKVYKELEYNIQLYYLICYQKKLNTL